MKLLYTKNGSLYYQVGNLVLQVINFDDIIGIKVGN